ncbi:MAG: hypothetical protein R3E56_06685 [Burkholderiaceae bacterium]
MAVVYGFLYIPLFFMIVFSFNSTRQDAKFTGFSLRWYEALMRDNRIVDGFFVSLVEPPTACSRPSWPPSPPLCWCATGASWGARFFPAWSTRRW